MDMSTGAVKVPREPGPVEREVDAIREVSSNLRSAVDELEKAITPVLGSSPEPTKVPGTHPPYGVVLADNLTVLAAELCETRDRLFSIKRRVAL